MSFLSRTKTIAHTMCEFTVNVITVTVETTKAVWKALRTTPPKVIMQGILGTALAVLFIASLLWGLVHIVPIVAEIIIFTLMIHLWILGMMALFAAIAYMMSKKQATA